MAALEVTMPTTLRPANDGRYSGPMRGFDVKCRLRNGHTCTLTTVARNSTLAILHAEQIYGEQLKGVTPMVVL